MNERCPSGLRPDPEFYGAGLHAMERGGFLDIHLDCDRHPVTGFRRAVNAILFLDAWKPSWGGALEFWSTDRCEAFVPPDVGRLVTFATGDTSYHGIPEPLRCPAGTLRRSLAVYWWEPSLGEQKRPRAQFVARPGEEFDPAKEDWRAKRACKP